MTTYNSHAILPAALAWAVTHGATLARLEVSHRNLGGEGSKSAKKYFEQRWEIQNATACYARTGDTDELMALYREWCEAKDCPMGDPMSYV